MASRIVSSELDFGMKPAAPNSKQWRITARSSLPDTTITGIEGCSERRNKSPENPRTPGMVKSSNTRSAPDEACSAATMLSKSCATVIRSVRRRCEYGLANPPTTSGWSSATSTRKAALSLIVSSSAVPDCGATRPLPIQAALSRPGPEPGSGSSFASPRARQTPIWRNASVIAIVAAIPTPRERS